MQSLRDALTGTTPASGSVYKNDRNLAEGPPDLIVTDDGFLPRLITQDATSGHNGRYDAIPAAYLAVSLISYQIATLPRSVSRKVGKAWQPESHPVQMILDFPSRILDPVQCWTMIFRDMISRGNGYAWIRRGYAGKEPIELVPARPYRIEFKESRYAPYQEYDLYLLGSEGQGSVGTRQQRTTSHSTLSFNGPGFNGLYSPSPIAFAASNIGEGMISTVQHYQQLLNKGLSSRNVIMVDKDYQASYEAWRKVVEKVRSDYRGAATSGKIPTLPPGFKIEQLNAFSADDLQLIELLKWGLEDIARVFMISPVRLGHYHEGMRSRTFEAQAVDFERYTIQLRTSLIDSQLSWKLLSPDDLKMGLRIHTDTSSVSLGTLTEQIEATGRAAANFGIMTRNEARAVMGMIQDDDPESDKLQDPKGAPSNGGGQAEPT